MKNKNQTIMSDVGIKLRNIVAFFTFVILTLSLSCLSVIAEGTEEEKFTTVRIEGGGDVAEDLPVKIYGNSEGVSTFSDLPDSVDLSADKYFPPIRKQQGNSCASWSTVYYQFTYQAARLNNWDAKHDDSKVFSPKYVWNYLNNGADNGTARIDNYKVLKEHGALRWSEFPQNDLSFDWYRGSNDAEMTALRNALKTRLSKYYNYNFAVVKDNPTPITSCKDEDLVHMKTLLNEGYVLSVSTDCYNWKYLNGENIIISGERTEGAHALTIVGYNDNISCDLNSNGSIESFEQGAFLIANSWGTDAANHKNGYVWLMYDALNEKSASGDAKLNTADRHRFLRNNQYYYIEVENYNPQRVAEVTVEQKYRNDITVKLARSNSLTSRKSRNTTFLNGAGGKQSFDGGNNGYQTCTFVFDYNTLYTGDDKVYWVEVIDNEAKNGASTTIKKIRWTDGNGKVLKTIGQQPPIDGESGLHFCGVPVKSITLNKTSSTLYVGESEQLTADILPENATEKKVIWKSSNTSVVQVDWETGKVTCVGTGTATVTATATDGSGVSASCTYRINDDYHDTPEKAFAVFLHGKISGAINRSGDVDYFKFIPTVTGTYLIYTSGSANTVGYLYDADQNLLLQNDDAGLSGKNFALQCRLEAGKTYYIKVNGYGTATGAYTLNIAKDFYSASLASLNQDARRVQMQGEAASVLTRLKLTIGNRTYVLDRPENGPLNVTVNGVRFKVTFTDNNNGLSTIWKIEADIPATTGGGDTVSFDFSKGSSIHVKSSDITGLIAYGSAVRTGVEADASDSLQRLLTVMKQTNHTLTVRNQNNVLINVTSATRAATGMKIIETDQNGWIVKIHYLVVFGDVTGDGLITTDDGLAVLQAAAGAGRLGALAEIAADADHDGIMTTDDSLTISQHTAGVKKINQNYTVTEVPDDCYYLDSVIF